MIFNKKNHRACRSIDMKISKNSPDETNNLRRHVPLINNDREENKRNVLFFNFLSHGVCVYMIHIYISMAFL